MIDTASQTKSHTWIEDAQGIVFGTFMCALGLQFLTFLGLVTGQTAGLAVIVSYLTGWPFGAVFFVVNLPFYWLAWQRMGRIFTVKSLISVTLLSGMVELLPAGLTLAHVTPALGALIVGALTGAGLLALFRHGGSLGGIGVVALYLQDRFGLKAGYVQLGFDAALFSVAAFLFPPSLVFYSLLGAVVLNLIIAVNHRRDRYIAT
ncbi:YitT family protein [Maribius pontilimi]|uniref:YitT family protein n=1 Tax=Palleronia pontilimi TaxID=1964209 RepID=A0A934I9M0_9RHOB|nr:YitT family protein [Palleronia pontilimi]MBJ3763029.1 YitT family protein [Palleronia pontilimi]